MLFKREDMGEKISIIVPVYNVETYIGSCIQSLLEQTHDNIEIILVDDGSKDRSGVICDEYAKLDSRIIVIHQSNAGVSAARNRGIDIAKGDYIGFVDADDYIASDMYKYLLSVCCKFNVAIAQCDRLYTYKTYENKEPIHYKEEKIRIIDSESALHELLCSQDVRSSLWSKLYRKELFDNVRLDPCLIAGEDCIANYQLIKRVSKIAVSNRKCYYYYQREDSCTKGEINEKIYNCIAQTKMYADKETDIRLKKSWDFNIAVKAINYLRRSIIMNQLEHFDELRTYVMDAKGVLLQPIKYRVKKDKFIIIHILLLWLAPELYKRLVQLNNR